MFVNVLCCAVLCCAVLCCAVLCCAVLCCSGKGSEIGDYLTTHSGVDCISFTGGDTGISISKKAGMVPLQMELGGKDACIVCRWAAPQGTGLFGINHCRGVSKELHTQPRHSCSGQQLTMCATTSSKVPPKRASCRMETGADK
jgi:hypothetical protein